MSILRVKWHQVKIDSMEQDIFNLLKKNKYQDDSNKGFIDVELKDSVIRGCFASKSVRTISYLDPFGELNEQEVVDFSYTNFELFEVDSGVFLMAIINPPKSLKAFTNEMAEIFNFKIFFKPISIDINDFMQALKKVHKTALLKIKKLKLSGLVISSKSKAAVEISSVDNASDDVDIMTKGMKHTLDKVRCSVYIDDRSIDFEVSKSGTANFLEEDIDIFNQAMLNYMSSKV